MIHLALFVISKGLFVIFPPQWMEINAIFLLFRLSILFLVLVLLTRMRTMLGMKPTINVNFSVLTGRANTLTTFNQQVLMYQVVPRVNCINELIVLMD